MVEQAFLKFETGRFHCICLSDGGAEYPIEKLFANAPKAEVEQKLRVLGLPIDHVWTPYTFLYVDTGDNKVLVDMGAGNLRPTTGKLLQSMAAADLDPESIDTVLITHAHPDHVGGTLDKSGSPIYVNARYFIWKEEWDFWFSDRAFEMSVPRPAAERFVATARSNLAPLEDRVTFLNTESEVLPGISVMAAPGHTPGHMVIIIASAGQQLLYASDTVLHPFHLENPTWLPIFDILPDKAADSKQRVFDVAVKSEALVIGQHFAPFPSLGCVHKHGDGWCWQPLAPD